MRAQIKLNQLMVRIKKLINSKIKDILNKSVIEKLKIINIYYLH